MEALIVSLISIILDAIGHEKAQALLSQEAMRRANLAADAVAAARKASGV